MQILEDKLLDGLSKEEQVMLVNLMSRVRANAKAIEESRFEDNA